MELYGELRDEYGHFPLMNYWGPMTNVKASQWIADSAEFAARRWEPDFFYIYLPHLDYAAQRNGPDSEQAQTAVAELDQVLGKLAVDMAGAYGEEPLWMAVGEYAMTPVDHVAYPNRVLREAGLLAVREEDGQEYLDFEQSQAFAMADHQLSHIYLADEDMQFAQKVADLFRHQPGIAEVLVGAERARYEMDHPRSGDIILISKPQSWQAYYWWLDDARAPRFARTVDIHRKPGYDPMELFFDPATKGIPLDAGRIRGSHGAPAADPAQKTVILASEPLRFSGATVTDTDVFTSVLNHFGLRANQPRN
jgi:predicted AlkP superfamily pyrophosphatase or phosphodiesterase